jgi:hypothetical protein
LRALIVASTFAVSAVATSVISVGAYCLTTDGGDVRRLGSPDPPGTGQSAEAVPVTVGAACPLAPPPGRGGTPESTVGDAIETTRTAGESRISGDDPLGSELKTATFALG